MIEAFFIRYAARFVPERFQRAVAWVLGLVTFLVVAAVLAGAVWGGGKLWLHFHDASVVEQHEVAREAAAAPAREKSAEERVVDAFANQRLRDERDDAIKRAAAMEAAKPVEQRATLPPTTIAFNCARLLHAYSSTELAKMPAYQEHCR